MTVKDMCSENNKTSPSVTREMTVKDMCSENNKNQSKCHKRDDSERHVQ